MPRRFQAVAAVLITLPAIFSGCGRAPSMGPDKETFVTVDALFSAVSLKDANQLQRNETTLKKLHAEGRLPDEAHEALAAIIAEAKSGGWETAGESLREFMLDQRKSAGSDG